MTPANTHPPNSSPLTPSHSVHSGRLTWNLKIDLWKTIFLYNPVVVRFHVNFPGCSFFTSHPFHLPSAVLRPPPTSDPSDFAPRLTGGTRTSRRRTWSKSRPLKNRCKPRKRRKAVATRRVMEKKTEETKRIFRCNPFFGRFTFCVAGFQHDCLFPTFYTCWC